MTDRQTDRQIIHECFIYNKHPQRYPQQHDFRQCGLFTIKAIIESYYPEINKKPIEYTCSWMHKLIKFSTPRQLSKTLKRHNISHITGKYKKKSTQSKIDFLKKHLQEGPIILLISHAYDKKNSFNIIKGILAQHYISIWGYDDEKECFYCYDSHAPQQNKDIPIGNIKLHYENIITYRNYAGIGIYKKRFIAIKH